MSRRLPALAIHPGALGDVLLAVPALRALGHVTGGPVTLAAQPRIAALLAALGVTGRALAVDALGLEALFTDDPATVPRLPDATRMVCWLGARDPVFRRRLAAVAPGAVVAPSVDARRPVWEHLLATVDAPPGAWREPLDVPPALRDAGEAALRGIGWDGGAPVVIVHPGAGSTAKRWPVDGFAAALARLARERDVTVVVHEGPADSEASGALRARLPHARWLREPSLPTLAGALSHASGFVGNDSGVSHLAAAVGTPCLALYLAEHRRWLPWAAAARCLTVRTDRAHPADVSDVSAALVGLLLLLGGAEVRER